MCGIKQLWPQGFGRQFPGRGSAIRFAGWCGSPGFCVDLALIGEESIHALDHLTAICTLFDRVRSKNLRRAWCRGVDRGRAHRASAGEHGVAVDGHSRIRAAHYQRAGGLPWWRRLMANATLTTLAATDLLVPPLPRTSAPALIVVAPVYVLLPVSTKGTPPIFSIGRRPLSSPRLASRCRGHLH
jgi:hypothetical protein